ncbi:hypothetical protein [Simiduia agarivorans]|uniref:hypothetical protein n=1 Tax=Simiduia agarivorans TaxID=447471 RepID=UPI001183083D|nr:hypothetical protein [Simiduia agarivorans]
MKHTCPHCGKQSISSWAKFNSSSLHPAICPSCQGHAKQHWASHPLEDIFYVIGMPGILLWSFLVESWWPIIITVLFLTVISTLKFRYVPMVAVDLSLAKKQHWFAFGCLLVVFIWVVSDAIGK